MEEGQARQGHDPARLHWHDSFFFEFQILRLRCSIVWVRARIPVPTPMLPLPIARTYFPFLHVCRHRSGLLGMICLVLSAPCALLAQDAVVEGTVQLPKQTPPPGAANARYGISPSGQTTGTPDAPVAVVYLEGQFPNKPAPAAPVKMAQHHAQFAPGVLPIQVGTTVEFPNLDDFYHNVFSYSKPKHFDLGRYRRDEKAASQLFDKPGAVTLHCEIHEAMRGTILVLDTPYFVKTDAAGRYRLEGLPAGHYTLKAWLSDKITFERSVDLPTHGVTHVSFP